MHADEFLADEALRLAGGDDIHKVTGLVATYRSVAHESDGCGDLDEAVKDLERELRSYVIQRRIDSSRSWA